MRVLLVDDYPPVRRHAREILLEAEPDTEIVEVGSAHDALDLVATQDWDAAIVDFNLPDESGLEVLGMLARTRPATRVIVVSALPSDMYALAARDAGARAFIPKEEIDRRLVAAVFPHR
jgi:DNA-binding NarL/FixJ family response regulator